MKRVTRAMFAVLLAAVGLLATDISPATAAGGGTITFSALVQTGPLGIVGLHNGVTGPVTITSTTACAAVGSFGAGTCTVTGSGVIGGPLGGAYCGNSTATLNGDIVINGNPAHYQLNLVEVGTTVLGVGNITLGSESGALTVVADKSPTDPAACLSGSATQYRMVATGSFVTT